MIWEPIQERTKLTRKQIAELFFRQQGRCPLCGQKLETKGHMPVNVMDEHMQPRWQGGSESLKNRSLVCRPCGREKTTHEAPKLAKSRRARDKHIGAMKSRSTFQTNRDGPYKKKMDGSIVRR